MVTIFADLNLVIVGQLLDKLNDSLKQVDTK